MTDVVFIFDIIVQLRTGYLEQGLMVSLCTLEVYAFLKKKIVGCLQVYDDKKLATHYIHSRPCFFDFISLIPFDLLQLKMGFQPLLRFTRFFKVSCFVFLNTFLKTIYFLLFPCRFTDL